MEQKGLDMIVANDVSRQETGFNSDENEVMVIWSTGEEAVPLASKSSIARRIMALIAAEAAKN